MDAGSCEELAQEGRQGGNLMATLTDTVLAQDRLCASLLARVQGMPK